MVLLPCGERLQNWVVETWDFAVYNKPSVELVTIKVSGHCLPHETPWCLTFLAREAALVDGPIEESRADRQWQVIPSR
jgi:hypothetical protein